MIVSDGSRELYQDNAVLEFDVQDVVNETGLRGGGGSGSGWSDRRWNGKRSTWVDAAHSPGEGLMYSRSAQYYDLLYDFKDYAAASAEIHEVIQRYRPGAESLLDVACGTGRHLEHLRAHYEVEGLDINEELLAMAHGRCADVPFHQGDMADFDIPGRFDVVSCLFSSIAYVRTEERLRSTVSSMSRHLMPGGIILLEPWFTPENFWTGTITANHVDRPELKIVWMYTSELADEAEDEAVLDMHYLVGTPQEIEHFTERHELGLFSEDQCRSAIVETGLAVAHDPTGPFGRGLYVGHSHERN